MILLKMTLITMKLLLIIDVQGQQWINRVAKPAFDKSVSHVNDTKGEVEMANMDDYDKFKSSAVNVLKDKSIVDTNVTMTEEKFNILTNVNEMFFTVQVNTKENETVTALCLNPKETSGLRSICQLSVQDLILPLMVFTIFNWVFLCCCFRRTVTQERREYLQTFKITPGTELIVTPRTSFKTSIRNDQKEFGSVAEKSIEMS